MIKRSWVRRLGPGLIGISIDKTCILSLALLTFYNRLCYFYFLHLCDVVEQTYSPSTIKVAKSIFVQAALRSCRRCDVVKVGCGDHWSCVIVEGVVVPCRCVVDKVVVTIEGVHRRCQSCGVLWSCGIVHCCCQVVVSLEAVVIVHCCCQAVLVCFEAVVLSIGVVKLWCRLNAW